MNLPPLVLAALAAISGLAAAPAAAQTMKPGLWEVSSKIGGNPETEKAMAQMQAQMAAMPPAQRKQMEEMMGKGAMGMGAGGAMAAKACITKDMIARGEMPTQQDSECTTTVSDKSSKGMKMAFVCPKSQTTGEGVYTFQGDTAYTMKMKTATKADGKPVTTTIDSSGKWLGSDCGSVKPMAAPKK